MGGRVPPVDAASEDRHPSPMFFDHAPMRGSVNAFGQATYDRSPVSGHRPPETFSQTDPISGGAARPDNGNTRFSRQLARDEQHGRRIGQFTEANWIGGLTMKNELNVVSSKLVSPCVSGDPGRLHGCRRHLNLPCPDRLQDVDRSAVVCAQLQTAIRMHRCVRQLEGGIVWAHHEPR